ncbi:energy transducer TonB [Kaarinaea lacus]
MHTTGASTTSIPLQVTLLKPSQEAPALNPKPKQSPPVSDNKENLDKSQSLKQVIIALKSDNEAKIQNREETRKVTENTVALTKVLNKPSNPLSGRHSNPVKTNSSKEHSNVIAPDIHPAEVVLKTLSQQQVARINAHLNQALDQYFSYPRLARRNGWQGTVKLGLRIESNGQLTNIQVLSTSGFPVLDQAALNTLNRISSLQNASIWLNGLHLDTVLPVHYKLVDI